MPVISAGARPSIRTKSKADRALAPPLYFAARLVEVTAQTAAATPSAAELMTTVPTAGSSRRPTMSDAATRVRPVRRQARAVRSCCWPLSRRGFSTAQPKSVIAMMAMATTPTPMANGKLVGLLGKGRFWRIARSVRAHPRQA